MRQQEQQKINFEQEQQRQAASYDPFAAPAPVPFSVPVPAPVVQHDDYMDIFGSAPAPAPQPANPGRAVSSWFQGSKPAAPVVDPFAIEPSYDAFAPSGFGAPVKQNAKADYDFTGSSGNNLAGNTSDPFSATYGQDPFKKKAVQENNFVDDMEDPFSPTFGQGAGSAPRDRSESEAVIEKFRLMYDLPANESPDKGRTSSVDSFGASDKDDFWGQKSGSGSRPSGRVIIFLSCWISSSNCALTHQKLMYSILG